MRLDEVPGGRLSFAVGQPGRGIRAHRPEYCALPIRRSNRAFGRIRPYTQSASGEPFGTRSGTSVSDPLPDPALKRRAILTVSLRDTFYPDHVPSGVPTGRIESSPAFQRRESRGCAWTKSQGDG